ncbi:MAG: hypothetical protein CBD58_02240 [bacterium TMED198]|nr:MAG: hypothetical protein CBD58_02240 [bacterium TMED198]
MNAIVIGGTGATGKQLIKQLLLSNDFNRVTSVGRRPVIGAKKHDKLIDVVIDSLHDLTQTDGVWEGHDVFFNCLGTTRSLSGSAENFIKVESGISNNAALMASEAKIPSASLISASGANHKQWSVDWIHPLLYIKTMGLKEQSILTNEFEKTAIFRPGMLIRSPNNPSLFEKFLVKTGLGLPVDLLARAMILEAQSNHGMKKGSRFYSGNDKIINLMDKKSIY